MGEEKESYNQEDVDLALVRVAAGEKKVALAQGDEAKLPHDCGGCEAAEICVEYGIMLVALPANATHFFQPLDVALFKPYKDCGHDLMLERLCAISNPVIRKTTAIGIACTAYRRALMDNL
ncbi:uncharacterized protein IUM83_03389 [Phytophthora cinnamomi]|uniref:uncharacterized protein n=1 Tax=Phytophthora cinnamomi TaxID=4785 RepID=UPI00355A9F04|nr:hypothetical protein IUM83_03389 [Phytophthora cinnamomi]